MDEEKSEDKDTKSIVKRLDAIIRLILEKQKRSDKIKIGEQIPVLKSVGLSTVEIARILGVKTTTIPSMLPRSSKRRRTKSKG